MVMNMAFLAMVLGLRARIMCERRRSASLTPVADTCSPN